MISIAQTSRGLIFNVIVLPRSAGIAIMGSYQGALKIKLTAPPVGGAANKQCIQVLSKALSLPKSALTIVKGNRSRSKQVCIRSEALPSDADDLQALRGKISLLSAKSA